jgi:hypothetical protein
LNIIIGPSARQVTLHGLADHFASPGIALHIKGHADKERSNVAVFLP